MRARPARSLWFGAAAAIAAAAVLWVSRGFLLPVILAGALAYILSGPVRYLAARGMPRHRAVQGVFFLALGLIVVLGVWVVPELGRESDHLLRQLPRIGHGLDMLLLDYDRMSRSGAWPETYRRAGDAFIAAVEQRVVGGLEGLAHGLLGAAPLLIALGVAPWIGYYFLRDGPRIRATVLGVLPPEMQGEAEAWLRAVDRVLSGYLRGQFVVAAVVGVLAFSVMTAFGLGYGATVGLVAGLTDMVPFVGPLLGALPAVAIASGRSLATAGWVAVSFLLIHETEGNFLAPWLVGEQMGLHPVLIVAALFIGGDLAGVPGLLLAAPVTGILVATLRIVARRLLMPRPLR